MREYFARIVVSVLGTVLLVGYMLNAIPLVATCSVGILGFAMGRVLRNFRFGSDRSFGFFLFNRLITIEKKTNPDPFYWNTVGDYIDAMVSIMMIAFCTMPSRIGEFLCLAALLAITVRAFVFIISYENRDH